MLSQLPYAILVKFPATLTCIYACDYAVISLMKSRTPDNSSKALKFTLMEMHSETWIRRNIEYLNDCQNHKKALQRLSRPPCEYAKADMFRIIPNAKSFLAAYVRDVWTRLDTCKASITSVFGEILKINSTKKG